ncbi:MAG: hypothetical protein ACR2PL_22830 [Dehalococcoidia bacterium]
MQTERARNAYRQFLKQGLLLLQHGARWGMAYTLAGCAGMTILAAAALRHQREARTEVVATGVERKV